MGTGKDYFPLTLTLSPIGGEGIMIFSYNTLIKVIGMIKQSNCCGLLCQQLLKKSAIDSLSPQRGERAGVRGEVFDGPKDCIHNRISILQDLIIPKSKDMITQFL
jgi:hypothetical protein